MSAPRRTSRWTIALGIALALASIAAVGAEPTWARARAVVAHGIGAATGSPDGAVATVPGATAAAEPAPALAAAASGCGKEGQRACCFLENIDIGACEDGLAEIPGCSGDCQCGGLAAEGVLSSGTCIKPTPCGGEGQRACIVFERDGTPCNSGLTPVPGCSGDCFGKGAGSAWGRSTHTCAKILPGGGFEPMDEPLTNATPEPFSCSLSGYSDMHLHLFADLAHGGGVLAGEPYDYGTGGGVNEALEQDFTTDKNLVKKDGSVLGPPAGVTCPSYLTATECAQKFFHGEHDILAGDSVGNGTKDGATSNLGAPIFNGWPKWTSTTHQQAYYRWLKRAWQGGLRMTTMLAVTNEALCRAGRRMDGTVCTDSMDSIKQQLDAAKAFETWVTANDGDWFRIVYTPFEARDAIATGKLAVVLGVETAELFNCKFPIDQCELAFNPKDESDKGFLQSCDFSSETNSRTSPLPTCTPDYIKTQVSEWYDQGVRHVFPIHNFDNAFGGAATWMSTIEVGNRIVEDHWWSSRECSGDGYGIGLGGVIDALGKMFIALVGFGTLVDAPDHGETGSCNHFGLLPLGHVLMQELMKKGMIIDVDHMSVRSFDATLDMAENPGAVRDAQGNLILPGRTTPYPVVASHVQSFDMHVQAARHERMRTRDQLIRIKNTGGMIAAMLKDDVQDTDRKAHQVMVDYSSPFGYVKNDCRHSSKSFAQAYQYAVDTMGGPVAFGSDFNGVAGHFGPRFGSDACGGAAEATGADPFPVFTGDRQKERSAQYRAQNRLSYPFMITGFGEFWEQETGKKKFDYNVDGLAHIGLLPDMVADLKNIGLPVYHQEQIFKSAEAYIQMWERVLGETPPADTCTAVFEPRLTVAPPDTAYEGEEASVLFTIGKNWKVEAVCGPDQFSAIQGTVTRINSGSSLDEYDARCTFLGGDWRTRKGTLTIKATKATTEHTATAEVTVLNRPPTIAFVGDPDFSGATMPMGQPFDKKIVIGEPYPELITITFSPGDGSPAKQVANSDWATDASGVQKQFALQHQYPGPGSYAASVTVADEIGPVTKTFTVTVTGVPDTTPPVVTVPDDFSVPAQGTWGAVVHFTVTAVDAVWGSLRVTCLRDGGIAIFSGWSLPTGVWPIVCSATDGSGNTGTGTFTITVEDPPPPVIVVPQFKSPAHRWRFDEPARHRAVDSGLVGSPAWNASSAGEKVNMAIENFGAASNCPVLTVDGVAWSVPNNSAFFPYADPSLNEVRYVRLGNVTQFGTGDFTVALWFKTGDHTPGPQVIPLVTNRTSSGGDFSLELRSVQVNGSWARHKIQFSGGTSGDVSLSAEAQGSLSDETWHHVVLRRQGTKFTLTLDGQLGSAGTATTASPKAFTHANALIAGWYNAGETPFVGALDDVQIFRSALADADVEILYRSTLEDFSGEAGGECQAAVPDILVDATQPGGGATVSHTITARSPQTGEAETFECKRLNGDAVGASYSYPAGVTRVVCTSGPSTVHFNVVVNKFTGPLLTVPPDMVADATTRSQGVAVASLAYSVTAVGSDGAAIGASCTANGQPVSTTGGTFPAGTTVVTCSATVDGRTASDSFSVRVDDRPPVVTVAPPAGQPFEATGPGGAAATFDAVATDVVDGSLPVTCSIGGGVIQSGGTFAIGTSTVVCTATDGSGGTGSASFAVTVVDTTAPAIAVAVTPDANAAGWHRGPASIDWTVTDVVGVATTTGCDDVTVDDETFGAVYTCTARDAAGNTAKRAVAIRLDRTGPAIQFGAAAPAANANGWHRGNVTVPYTVSDGVSGLPIGATGDGSVSFTLEGAGMSQEVVAVDAAGNESRAHSPLVNIDRTAPTIAGAPDRAPNASGWYNAAVTIAFECADALSGVAGCTSAQTLAAEGAGQSAAGVVTDRAGNSASTTVGGVSIDTTPPAVTTSRTPANAFGWNNADVTVGFAATDGLSGIAGSPSASYVVSTEGEGQSRSHTFTDRAGNTASATVGGINIDKTAPIVTCSNNAPALWPPNHKLVPILTSVNVDGGVSGALNFTLVSATSNEPDNGLGDGDTANDIQGFAVGTADTTGQLRAERSGRGNGRLYTLAYQGLDLAGNAASCTTQIAVPHNARR
jgi:microsomal dipeptidase-like Zn-dependent dipeptidase